VLREYKELEIPEFFLAELTPECAETRLAQERDALSHTMYDLTVWPQHALQAFRLSIDKDGLPRHAILGSFDAWCLDMQSLQIIFNDLADLYLGHIPPPVPEPAFRDYVLALEDLKHSEAYAKSLTYWKKRVTSLPLAPLLPQALKANNKTSRFQRHDAHIAPESWARAARLIREKELSEPSVLLACYASVLSRWSETKRFSLNIPQYNRLPLHEDIAQMTGEIASFSILEVDNENCQNFEQLARQIQQRLWMDLEHSHVSGLTILREWKAALKSPPAVLAPYVFTGAPDQARLRRHENDSGGSDGRAATWLEALSRIGETRNLLTQTPQVWIDSQFVHIKGGLYVSWDCRESQFPEGLPARMFEAYAALIQSLERPEPWERAEISLPASEKPLHDLLMGPKALIRREFPSEALKKNADLHPEDLAAADKDGRMTWWELDAEVSRWAAYFRKLGVRERNVVAFALPKSRLQLVASMAIHRAGAIQVAVDHESPLERLASILGDCRACLVLSDGSTAPSLAPLPVPILNMEERETHGLTLPKEPATLEQEDLYCIVYTSGSTGVPKGVMITLESLLNVVQSFQGQYAIGPKDKLIAVSPVYHDLGHFDLAGGVLWGSSVIFPDSDRVKDPGHWMECIRSHEVTLWSSVPPMMTMLLDYCDSVPDMAPQTPSLRLIFLGGDWIPLDTPKRIRKTAPDATALSNCGPTETAIYNIAFPMHLTVPGMRSIPIGLPINNTGYHILDSRTADCPAMVAGEICCSGAGISPGYVNDPVKTAAAFVHHPVTGVRMFRTGDLGRLHQDGYVEFIGRQDSQVKVNGYRIELGELECVMTMHPAVSQTVALVLRRPGAPAQLAQWVVLKPGQEASVETLREHMYARLPKYMRPRYIGVVSSFPLTKNNKLDRTAIAAWPMDADRKPATAAAAANETENLLLREWSSLLGRKIQSVDENFFEAGGDSIAAVRLYGKVIASRCKSLSVADVFAYPTIRELAALMDAPDANPEKESDALPAWPLLEPLRIRLPFAPATYAQRRIYADQVLNSHNACYNLCLQVSVLSRTDEALNLTSLADAFNRVAAANEVLRTVFEETLANEESGESHLLQRILPRTQFTLVFRDLKNHNPADRQAEKEAFCRELTLAPFDLKEGPLLRAGLVLESATKGSLYIVFHHILFDGGSMSLFLEQLSLALDGRPLPSGGLQQADVGVWEHASGFERAAAARLPLACEGLEKGGEPSRLVELFSSNDWPGREEGEPFLIRMLSDACVQGVANAARQAGVTPFAVYCAALGYVVAEYTRSEKIQIGTYLNLRSRPGLEQTMGVTVNPAPLLFVCARDRSLLDCAQEAMRALSRRMEFVELPFDRLVRHAAPPRIAGEHPLFDLAITYDDLPGCDFLSEKLILRPDGGRQFASNLGMEFAVTRAQAGRCIAISYDQSRFSRSFVGDILSRYVWVIKQIVEDPTRTPAKIRLATPQDREAIARFNDSAGPELPWKNLVECFREQVARRPEAPAVYGPDVATDDLRQVTYQELDRRSSLLAQAMRASGVAPGSRVMICLPRSVNLVVAMVAVWKCGAAFITQAVSTAADRLGVIVKTVSPVLTYCLSKDVGRFAGSGSAILTAEAPLRPKAMVESTNIPVGPEDDACLFFTSGSTGVPKGARLTHANWLNRLAAGWETVPYDNDEACISKTTIGFGEFFCETFQPLLGGAKLCIVPDQEERDTEVLVGHLREWRITRATFVVSLLHEVLEFLRREGSGLEHFRHVLATGERLPVGVARLCHKVLPGAVLYNFYGSTEMSADVAYCRVRPVQDETSGMSVPLGKVMRNARLEILSPCGTPLPTGVAGEIAVGGQPVIPGYLNGGEEKFFLLEGERFFASGDLGMWTHNGELLYLGRTDRQVKIRGQRIEIGEVEEALLAHPDVVEAVAFALGENIEAQLTACVVLRKKGAISMEALIARLKNKLSGAMLPSRLLELDAIPRNTNGKTDLLALKSQVAKELASVPQDKVLPLTQTEKKLARLWESVTQSPLTGRNADFFSSGGHSLLTTRLSALIREEFGVPLKVKDVFTVPVFSDLAKRIDLLASSPTDEEAAGGRAAYHEEVF
jgi:amino acid adenylation domain-containing protein